MTIDTIDNTLKTVHFKSRYTIDSAFIDTQPCRLAITRPRFAHKKSHRPDSDGLSNDWISALRAGWSGSPDRKPSAC